MQWFKNKEVVNQYIKRKKRKCIKNKKVDTNPPFCPKSYHELNLLMLWWCKYIVRRSSKLNKAVILPEI